MTAEELKQYKAKQMRYKKPMLKYMNLEYIQEKIWDMGETISDVQWFVDDQENLVNALNGDEDEAYEFKMAFSDLAAEIEQFEEDLRNEYVPDCFDDLFHFTKRRGQMTKDRALRVLGVYASVNGSGQCTQDEFEEAKKMAIEALEGKDTNVPSRKGVFIPYITVEMFRNATLEGVEDFMTNGEMEDISLPSAQPQYEELTPEEAAPEIASGSILRASYWLDVMIALKQMGYAICRKKG